MKRVIKVYASDDSSKGRKIVAANDGSQIHPALESFVDEAYRRGYNVYIEGDSFEKSVIDITPRDKDLPEMTAWLDCSKLDSDGIVYLEGKIKCKDINTRDLDFADSAEYQAKKILEAAKLLTYMLRNPISLEDWEED